MLRAIVGVLSLGLLVTLLASTADSAPGRRGGGRASGVSARAGNGPAQNLAPGRNGSGVRQFPGNTPNIGGPINATPPQAGGNRFPGFHNGTLNVPTDLPGAGQLPERSPGQVAANYGVNAGGPAPFSPAWYGQHPNAWQITHPHAGEAVVAVTALGLASFMAIESGTVSGGNTTIVYGSEATAEQTQAATELAQAGEDQVDQGGPWMAIGAFAFCPMDVPNATRMIQLAVNPQGTLRGTHYDLLSEETADIIGAVDRNTSQVSWRIGENGHVIFESDLAQLTQPQGQVRVHFPDGQTGQWAVTRLQQ